MDVRLQVPVAELHRRGEGQHRVLRPSAAPPRWEMGIGWASRRRARVGPGEGRVHRAAGTVSESVPVPPGRRPRTGGRVGRRTDGAVAEGEMQPAGQGHRPMVRRAASGPAARTVSSTRPCCSTSGNSVSAQLRPRGRQHRRDVVLAPARMPLGLTMGTVTLAGRLHLAFATASVCSTPTPPAGSRASTGGTGTLSRDVPAAR